MATISTLGLVGYSNLMQASALSTLNGRLVWREREWRFSVTSASAPVHSVKAAMKASAGLRPFVSYLAPKKRDGSISPAPSPAEGGSLPVRQAGAKGGSSPVRGNKADEAEREEINGMGSWTGSGDTILNSAYPGLFTQFKEFFYRYAGILKDALQRPAVNFSMIGDNQGNLIGGIEDLNMAAALSGPVVSGAQ